MLVVLVSGGGGGGTWGGELGGGELGGGLWISSDRDQMGAEIKILKNSVRLQKEKTQ